MTVLTILTVLAVLTVLKVLIVLTLGLFRPTVYEVSKFWSFIDIIDMGLISIIDTTADYKFIVEGYNSHQWRS